MENQEQKTPIFSEKIHEATLYCIEKHRGQTRKNSVIPYYLHSFDVLKRVLSYEEKSLDQHILGCAACTHDIIEETKENRETIKSEIKERFGDLVLSISQELTNADNLTP